MLQAVTNIISAHYYTASRNIVFRPDAESDGIELCAQAGNIIHMAVTDDGGRILFSGSGRSQAAVLINYGILALLAALNCRGIIILKIIAAIRIKGISVIPNCGSSFVWAAANISSPGAPCFGKIGVISIP